MNTLLETALSNVLMAALLAIPAAVAALWGRRPALTHGLFLLVLLKLVTPPLFRVPIAWPEPPASLAEERPTVAPVVQPALVEPGEPAVEKITVPEQVAGSPQEQAVDVALEIPVAPLEPALAEAPAENRPDAEPPLAVAPVPCPESSIDWPASLGVVWLAGSAAWLMLAIGRLVRFRRVLRFALPAPEAVQTEAHALADCMGVRCPQVLLLPGAISPMLWTLGGAPCLLLPSGLVPRLRPEQLATLLAHELAHWRRGDHRVRWLEMLALAVYWWCPLAWWARRQLHQAEEECCDAWVVAVLPDSARDYALALVDTIDFLSGVPSPLPPVASGVGHVRLLKRRLTMILRGTTPRSLTRTGLLAVAGLGVFLLPFVPGLAQQPRPETNNPFEKRAIEIESQFFGAQQAAQATQLKQEVDRARQIQQELDQRQKELDELRKQIEVRLKQLQASGQTPTPAAKPVEPGKKPTQANPYGTSDPETKLPMAGRAGGGGMMAGTGGMMGGTGGMMGGAGGMKSAGVEQRLEQVERKLDALLWEITNLRRDMTKGSPPQGFGGGAMVPPGWGGVGGQGMQGGQPGKAAPGGLPGGGGFFKPGSPPMGGTPPQGFPPGTPGLNVPGGADAAGGGLPRAVTPGGTAPTNPPAGATKGN